MKRFLFVALAAILALPNPAFAQAFGISMGDQIASISIQEDLGNNLYRIAVPSPHPEFETYVLEATPETGACMVRGVGKDHENDAYGLSVRAAFAGLSKALVERYGQREVVDFLRSGALWKDTDEWVMSLRQNERAYQEIWETEYNSSLPDTMSEIILGVSASARDDSYVVLQYRFSNFEACKAIREQTNNSGL